MLNRVEGIIRTFDPFLNCSTHALDETPLQVSLIDSSGRVVNQLKRS